MDHQDEHENKLENQQDGQAVLEKISAEDDNQGIHDNGGEETIPWITWSLITLNSIVFVIETIIAFSLNLYPTFWSWIGISKDAQTLLKAMGALTSDSLVWAESWRLLACLFLHVGLFHYILNMRALWQLRRAEYFYGKVGYLIIYLLGGLGASVGAMVTFLLFPDTPFVAGASGAIYAIATAYVIKERNPFHSSGQDRLFDLLFWGIWILQMFLGNPFGHICGAICGGLIGTFWLRFRTRQDRKNVPPSTS